MLGTKVFIVGKNSPASQSITRTDSRRQRSFRTAGELKTLTAADIVELEQKVRENNSSRFDFEHNKELIPLYACLLWIFGGTVFYAVHDKFGWALGLYMSVNIGWSMGWATPKETDQYENYGSKIFSTFHTSIGVVFVGIAVMYMAKKMTENRDGWMADIIRKKQVAAAAHTDGYMDDVVALFTYYMPKYKAIVLFLFWIIFGVTFITTAVNDYDTLDGLDFVLSTLSGAGYVSLPISSPEWQYVIIALYTTTGVPITAIAVGMIKSINKHTWLKLYMTGIGMILSFVLVSEDNSIFEKIIAEVTDDELEFMKMFGIDDGDGTLDNREFIILTVVRIGAAPPTLISQINERFTQLDRKRTGHIRYEDIVYGLKKQKVALRFKAIVKRNKLEIARQQSYTTISAPRSAPHVPRRMSSDSGRVFPVETFNSLPQGCENTEEGEDIGDEESLLGLSPNRSDSDAGLVRSHPDKKSRDSDHHSDEDSEYGEGVVMPLAIEEDVGCEERKCKDSVATEHQQNIKRTITPLALVSFDEENQKESAFPEIVSKRAVDVDLSILHSPTALKSLSQSEQAPPNKSVSTSRGLGLMQIAAASEVLQQKKLLGGEEMAQRDVLMERNSPDAKLSKSLSMRSLASGDSLNNLTAILNRENISISRRVKAGCWWIGRMVHALLNDPFGQAFVAWILWLASGTVFFMLHTHYGFYRSLFRSVSVGYGIFWVAIDPGVFANTYIRLHFVIGVAAIGGMMAVFARYLADSKSRWYVEAMKKQALQAAGETEGYMDDIVAFALYYWPKLQVHVFFALWVIVGIVVTTSSIGWSILDGIYFSLASMTTGGLHALPDDSPEWCYLFTAIYILVGVPVMAVSFGLMANAVINAGGSAALADKISARITNDELDLMKSFGIEDGDGAIDNKEYVILILVRIGALAPDLIRVINSRFQTLDTNHTGSITYQDLQKKGTTLGEIEKAQSKAVLDMNHHHMRAQRFGMTTK